jgi:hypothetical protein
MNFDTITYAAVPCDSHISVCVTDVYFPLFLIYPLLGLSFSTQRIFGAHGSIVVKALLQEGRSRVRDPIRRMIFFFNVPNLSGRTRRWGLLSL